MALGALTLPSVSTGFTSDSKAMVPVSIQGMADKVTKMSPLESMQEVFFDIRDGILILGDVFSEKISGLNEHLAFRLEKLNQTMSNIGNLAAKDLGFEKKTFDIIKQNEAEDERNESLGNRGDESSGTNLLDTIRDRFNGLIDLLTPKSQLGKVGLLGALTLGIISLLPKLEKAFEGIFKFTGEKLIPFLDSIFDIKDEEGEFKWDKILGIGLGAYVTAKLLPSIMTMAFKLPGGGRAIGYAALATWAMGSAIAKVGDVVAAQDWTEDMGATDSKLANSIGAALGGDVTGGLINSLKNASKMGGTFALIGAGIGSFIPVVGTLAGALIGGALGIVVGGILGFFGGGRIAKFMDSIGTFVSETYENMVQGIKDFFFDREIVGGAGESYTQRSGMGKIKDQMMENFENNMKAIKDFFFDDKGNLFGINFGGLKDLLPTLREIADKIVSSLPKWMRPDTLQEKIDDKRLSIEKREDEIARSEAGENVYFGLDKPERDRQRKILAKEKGELIELENEMKTIYPGIETGDNLTLDTTTGSSISSGKELKSVAQIRAETGAPPMVTIAPMTNTTQGDNIAVANNSFVGTPRVEGLDARTNALLDYFRR